MSDLKSYPTIDIVRTGKNLRCLIETAGYRPRDIQEYLELSCIQPIYRWYNGQTIPNLDHLLQLCDLLQVNVEDIVARKNKPPSVVFLEILEMPEVNHHVEDFQKRVLSYTSLLSLI